MLVDTCLVRSAQRLSVAPPGSSDPEPRLPCPPADPPFTLRPGTCFSLKWLQERNEETPSQERPAAELRGVSILQGQTSPHLGVWVIVDTSGYETPPGGRRTPAARPLPHSAPSPAYPASTGRSEASTSPASEALQTGGGAQDGWGGRKGAGWGRTHAGPPAHARRSERGRPHHGGGKAGRGGCVCACSQASSGATACRGGEGKAGPGAGEESGCLPPSWGLHTPPRPTEEHGAGGGDGDGWVGRAQSGTSGCAGSPLSPRR